MQKITCHQAAARILLLSNVHILPRKPLGTYFFDRFRQDFYRFLQAFFAYLFLQKRTFRFNPTCHNV